MAHISNQQKMFRLIVAIMYSVLCVLVTSGCTKEESLISSASSGTEDSSGESEQIETLKSALKYDVNDNLDLGGRTLTISAWGTPTAEGVDEYMDRRYELEKRTEAKYNVNIEWVSTNVGTFVQDVALDYASGKKYADLMFTPSYYGFDLAKLGAIIPLDDYIDYSSPYYSLTGDNSIYVDGKHYSYFPDEYSVNSLGYFIVYNETLLSKAGCEDPYTLYKNGEWTWDAFEKIVQQTTITRNGEVVQYGIGGSNLLDALCLSDGFSLISMNTQTNKFECGLYTDAGTNVLNFLKTLTYDLKGCDGNYGGHNSIITFGDSKEAMIVCAAYYPSNFISSGMPIYSVPMPKGPDTDQYVNGLEMQEWWTVSAISDFSKEELLQVALDMNENDPAYSDTYLSEEGKEENFENRLYDNNVVTTEKEAKIFYNYITDSNVDTILNISTTDIKSVMRENVFNNIADGEDPRSVLERVSPVINQALEDMLPDRLK